MRITSVALLLLLAAPARGAVLVVDDDLHDCPGAAYTRIGDAVAAAAAGDQVQVCAGTYREQVVITKRIRLVGTPDAVLQATDLPETRTSLLGGRLVTAGVIVVGVNVVIIGVTVDLGATSATTCSPLLAGIYLRGASGLVRGVTVSHVRVASEPACDSGVGLYVESADDPLGPPTKVTVRQGTFADCQKAGVVANGSRTLFRMQAGHVTGDGPGAAAVQTGVQIGPGVRGKVSAAQIAGYATSVAGRTAAGVVAYRASRATVRGTTIQDGQTGIFIVGRSLLRQNMLTNLTADGIVLFGDNSSLVGNTVDGAGVSGIFVNGTSNKVHFGSIANTPVGLWFYGGAFNSFGGVSFAESVPLQGQGVYGGARTLTALSAAPLLPACQIDADCDDASPCTQDTCDVASGTCSSVLLCDDGNPCTDDGCTATGCQSVPNTASCSDGNACTVGDVCHDGTCEQGLPIVCDDGNPCMTGSCSPQLGCLYTPVADGTPCPTGTCTAGACS